MFDSYFMAGFECATGFNRHDEFIDQVVATEHDLNLTSDYRLLQDIGIRVVREGVRWPVIDPGRRYAFSSLDRVLEGASETGMQLIYDLFHYGYPERLDPFSPDFVTAFADYCSAVAERIALSGPGPHYFTPVNEPSYLSWAAGDAGLFAPRAYGRSFDLKVQFARCAIAGIEAIRSVIPGARMVNVDPICRVVPPRDQPELADEARWFNEVAVFEAWDIIAGRLMPELGGSPAHLDIVGINYYWTNQWEHGRPGNPLDDSDERAWSLSDLIRWVWHRYRREMILTETSHVGERRPGWIETVAEEVAGVLDERIPLRGVCLYPVLGMPEWHERDVWTCMGLWDLNPSPAGLRRVPCRPALAALQDAQSRLEGLALKPMRRAISGWRRML